MDFRDIQMTVDLETIETGLHYLAEILTEAGNADTAACILKDYYTQEAKENALLWMQTRYDSMRAALGLAGCFMELVSAGLTNDEIRIVRHEEPNKKDEGGA